MSSTPRYAHTDTKRPDGCYVQFEMITEPDDSPDAPDERDDGFWPSRDPKDAGYVGADNLPDFDRLHADAQARMDAWKRGDWGYVGVRARAKCLIVVNRVGTYVNIDSGGCWGIESDAGDYLDEVYRDEIAAVKDLIAAMAHPIYED
ncbi:MAG: hypothetical protein J2P55_00050 [Rhizobiales bacterium]|nr:hypothetical protein [Hyphomicrobiales bacterium]